MTPEASALERPSHLSSILRTKKKGRAPKPDAHAINKVYSATVKTEVWGWEVEWMRDGGRDLTFRANV
eukprot:CAMPEP_0113665396 /NCGR_PEP_ID=MMETSP0038_2-20120614/2283_1 /TAXON_ID=2898 /ORGANISM="Cryptomonas paramecium" /LENGTH=67 /DNA_ID=CAMNT_0000580747 /DNA_START=63 /DNA_END=266 /DNA_ORIENTATION=- /assembly_acc=CAM_ASM_000170